MEIVLGVTGSIAAYKAGELILTFQDLGWEVKVVMTRAAKEFISELTLATLSRCRVYCEVFEDQVHRQDVLHVSLAQAADLVVVAPATANFLGRLAAGMADDLLTCTVLATRAPVLIAPAMNENMYRHPLVQRNIRTLEQSGYYFVGPRRGRLACGITGEGAMACVEEIVKAAQKVTKACTIGKSNIKYQKSK